MPKQKITKKLSNRPILKSFVIALAFWLGLFLVLPELSPERTRASRGVEASPVISTSSDGVLNLNAEPGTFSSVSETINVETTNYTGYTLTLETIGSGTALVHTENSNYVIPTISLEGGASSKTSDQINGEYGYSVNGVDFLPVPTVGGGGNDLKTTNSATSGPDATSLTFGANPEIGARAGQYQNMFALTARANDAGYVINYDANAGMDVVQGMPNPLTQYGVVSGLEIYLSSAVPVRGGYEFLGWSESAVAEEAEYSVGGTFTIDPETQNNFTLYAVWQRSNCEAEHICYMGNGDDGTGTMSDQVAASDSNVMLTAPNYSRRGYGFLGWNVMADGSGTMYGPMETIHTGDLSEAGMKLYAIWQQSEGLLQNFTGCSTMNTGEVTALTDFRDGETYAVAKLADGNCWTVENFRINPKTALLSGANTNGPTAEFLEKAAVTETSNVLCAVDNPGCDNTVAYNANNLNRSLTPVWDTDGTDIMWWGFGVFYNWYTATAGNGTYEMASGSVTGDFCPAGWKLPTSGASGDYNTLNVAINGGLAASDLGLRQYPANFVYSGDYNATITTGRGRQARIWSATAFNNAKAYRLGFSSTQVTPSNNWGKWDGFSIRCIAKTDNTVLLGNIHYDANGAEGTMADDLNVNLNTAAAKLVGFSHNNFVFSRWNTAADGSGTNVKDGDMVAEAARVENIGSGQTLNLYAIWGKTVTLSYDANGGTNAPDTTSFVTEGSTFNFTVSSGVPRWSDHVFLGWSSDSEATVAEYVGGDTFSTNNISSTLYAVWREADCAAGKLCYMGNGADLGTSFAQSANSNANTVLWPSDFSRDGYGFLGWNTAEDGSGTPYGPMATMKTGDLSTAGQRMWATWLASAGAMQNFSGCSTMSTGDVTALTDVRDGNTYAIAKLADGHCWMIENLRLDLPTATITAANTNSPTADFLAGLSSAASTITMCNTEVSSCLDKIVFDNNNINRDLTASYNTNDNKSSLWSYGVWYNWYAASAGNGTYSQTSGNVAGDICPKGWRLPTGGAGSEVVALNTAVNRGVTNNDSGFRTYPVNMVYAGDHNANKDSNRGTYARYWTATAADAGTAYRLGLKSNEVTPVRAYGKWDGFTVRCIVAE